MVTDVDERGIEVQQHDGTHQPHRGRHEGLGRGRAGEPSGRRLAEQSGAPLDRAGRIEVNPDLTLPGHPEVFVVGDMISLDDLPGVAQVAIQGAKYAAKQIRTPSREQPPQKPFSYCDKGSMATISPVQRGCHGRPAAVHRLYRLADVARPAPDLHHRLQEPARALLHWAVSFIGRGRSERTTTEQQIYARAAMKRLKGGAADLVGAPGRV